MAETTFERLRRIISEEMDVSEEEITPEMSFVEDMNAESLELVELLMSLEEEFGIDISDEEARSIQTVQDALEFIEERIS
ncbi:MAG: acyl carrier protein [Chloroflexi bacterium]|nr:acyl carrier protein [Chloroflexota bacterium]